jgi:hypothetical protein
MIEGETIPVPCRLSCLVDTPVSSVVDYKKSILVFVLVNKTQHLLIQFAMRVGGGNEESLRCEPVLFAKDLFQLVEFQLNLELVFIPLYQKDLNIAISRIR